IFIGAIDHNLYSINSSDGTQHAPPFQTGGEIDSSPAIAADGTVYIGASDGRLYAVLNQVQQWVFPPLNQNPVGQIHSSPAIGPDGAIYFGSDDGNLYAINGSSPLASSPWPMFQKDLRHTSSQSTGNCDNTCPPPVIDVQPQSVTVCLPCTPVTFTVSV